MRNRSRRFSSTIGIVLSLLVVLLLIALAQFLPNRISTQQAPQPVAQVIEATKPDSPLPTPTMTDTPSVMVGVTVIPPGEHTEPTLTPFPTWTLWPTPTRRDRPTPTLVPLQPPAVSPAGILQFSIDSNNISGTQQLNTNEKKYVHLTLPIDQYGKKAAVESFIELPRELHFAPYRIYFSPSKPYVVYMQVVEPVGIPYVFNLKTQTIATPFLDYGGGTFYGWHPDGESFLFWIDGVGLWLVNSASLELTTYLSYPRALVQGAAISPDGATIAFIYAHERAKNALLFMAVSGGEINWQFDTGAMAYLYPTAWSPDSSKLLYYGECGITVISPKGSQMPANTLCVFDLNAQKSIPLNVPFSGFPPIWSPDGQFIALTGEPSDQTKCDTSVDNSSKCLYQGKSIYIIDTRTGESTSVALGISPVWSPDGSMLAFLSNQTGQSEVWAVHIHDNVSYPLTSDGSYKLPNSLYWLPEDKQ